MMKSALFMLSVLLASKCVGQHKYIPFPDSVATWIIDEYDYTNWYPPKTLRYAVQMQGKKVINGKSYQNTSGLGAKGGIRQDTSLKKVYFFDYSDSTEYLLYDFSLKLGDTLRQYVYRGPSGCVIIEFDSILVNGRYHYTYLYDGVGHEGRVIEGIGNESGLFASIFRGEYHEWWLICVENNGESYYPNAGTWECNINVSVKPEKNEENNIELYPNPVKGFLYIISPYLIRKVSVHNLNGELLSFDDFNESLKVSLNLEDLKSGLYSITVTTMNGNIYRQIIVK